MGSLHRDALRAVFVAARVGFFVCAGAALVACARNGTTVESRELTTSTFDAYRTAAIEVDPKGFANQDNDPRVMLGYVESRLRSAAVLQPTPLDAGAELIVRARLSTSDDDDLHFIVDFVDAKSRQTIGQIKVSGAAIGDRTDVAMRHAADEIVEYVKRHRKSRIAQGADTAPAPQWEPAESAASARTADVQVGNCLTTCSPDSLSAVSPDERARVTAAMAPWLTEVQKCLERASAVGIHPAAIVRFDAGGVLASFRTDTGGYEHLACVEAAQQRPPAISIARAAALRCEHRCAR